MAAGHHLTRSYPWAALPTVPREAVGLLRSTRRAVRQVIREERIAEVLAELAGERAQVTVTRVDVVTPSPTSSSVHDGARVVVGTPDGAVQVELQVEKNLARALVARVVGRAVKLADPRHSMGPEVLGALAAVVSKVAQRASSAGPVLAPIASGALRVAPGERCIEVDATVKLGPEGYGVRATIVTRALACSREAPREALARLDKLPLRIPVVVAVSVGSLSELTTLSRGDIWMPGPGWTIRPTRPTSSRAGTSPTAAPDANQLGGGPDGAIRSLLAGKALLAPPASERGIAVKLGDDGAFVVVGVETTPIDVESKMESPNQADDTASAEVILDAPLVVRVELGAVTLTAREWSELGTGDVIALGRRVSEPVILRIAGLEVARGELVDVEGELGVRIREPVATT